MNDEVTITKDKLTELEKILRIVNVFVDIFNFNNFNFQRFFVIKC